MRPRDCRRIFVLPHEGVGDLIFLLPALHALKDRLPEASIQLAFSRTQQSLAGALDGKLVDAIPLYERGLTEVVRAVRAFKPDVYFEFDGGLRFALAGMFSAALRRIHPPRELVKPYAAILQPESLRLEPSGHCVDTLMSLLDLLEVPRRRISFEFEVPDRSIENATSIAKRYIPDGATALVPLSGHQCKDWPLESLQATINILNRDLGRPVVILGRDRYPADIKHAIDLGGKTDFLTDAYLLRYSGAFAVVVGVDTGMMQIAGAISSDSDGRYTTATGNRTVSLFGPTDSRIYRPYDPTGTFNVVVAPKRQSALMGAIGWAGDRFERAYMKEIEPQEIVDATLRQMPEEEAVLPRLAQGRH
jgi:ADP-heptose:LPS heptosyltransferase